MLRITDLESGKSVDLALEDVLTNCFREQIDLGQDRRKHEAFLQRLEHGMEAAIRYAVDLSLEPPLQSEITRAFLIVSALGIPMPEDAMLRRSAMLRFLRAHEPSAPPSPDQPTDKPQPLEISLGLFRPDPDDS
jgi:hypothetical protein